MIHRAPFGSFERFVGMLIEHFAGAFPAVAGPGAGPGDGRQPEVRGVRPAGASGGWPRRACGSSGDYRAEKIGAKIRDAQLELIPYMFVVGGREAEQRRSPSATGSRATWGPCPWRRPSRSSRRRSGRRRCGRKGSARRATAGMEGIERMNWRGPVDVAEYSRWRNDVIACEQVAAGKVYLLTKEDVWLSNRNSTGSTSRSATSPVRVIGADGDTVGHHGHRRGPAAARAADLDLVEVAPTESPPVCRIMDFGKFKYQQKKRQHKGHAHQVKIKEIRVRPKTGDHDIQVKVSRAREFLEHKDKVIVSVVFRGRELAHIEEGRRVIDEMLEQLEDVAKVEAPPIQHGRRIVCTLAPK